MTAPIPTLELIPCFREAPVITHNSRIHTSRMTSRMGDAWRLLVDVAFEVDAETRVEEKRDSSLRRGGGERGGHLDRAEGGA